MLIIGLTGGIGCGKSTVARYFADLGAPVIDADVIAREIVTPGSPALAEIVKSFGSGILLKDGALNRTKLRLRVFNDDAERRQLESILHPRILDEMRTQIARLHSPYCVLVIPLLFETTQAALMDRVLVVDAPESLQLARVKQRDGLPEAEAQSIIHAQIGRAARLQAADDVIVNDSDLGSLRRQVEKAHDHYLRLAAHPQARTGKSQNSLTPGGTIT